MDEQDIDREMVFEQMKKIDELKQQIQELKQREKKLENTKNRFLKKSVKIQRMASKKYAKIQNWRSDERKR